MKQIFYRKMGGMPYEEENSMLYHDIDADI